MLQSRYIETKNPGGFGEMEDIGADAFANAPCVQIVADPLLHHVKGQDGAAGVGGAKPLAVLLVIDAAGIGTGGSSSFTTRACAAASRASSMLGAE